MNRFIKLSNTERAGLSMTVGKQSPIKKLAEHYDSVKSYYDEWASELLKKRINFNGTQKSYSSDAVLSLLITRIKDMDGELYIIVNHPLSRQKLHLDHDQLCKLLARNSLATNPLEPSE